MVRLRDPFMDCVRRLDDIASSVDFEGNTAKIDATGLTHKELNDLLRVCVEKGAEKIIIKNVCGQRYIGTRLHFPGKKVEIDVFGIPGNDLGMFMNGHRIVVHGNAQDGVGNTMNDGEIVVKGRAGDVVAMSMRGGRIFIRDDVGYRTAIHMKEYRERVPVLVVGGSSQDFLGEYMAGGSVLLLGLTLKNQKHKANYVGTGMHGGTIYIRGKIEQYQLGKEVGVVEMEEEDYRKVESLVKDYLRYFKDSIKNFELDEIMGERFIKLVPVSKRPYGRIYTYYIRY
ncbi:MAG: hypothetical protein DSY33_03715 [Archaeoglobus sp.]|nr:MAG: hypothetical protein DSY33_03715 [Archaeoglobus sp.]